MYPARFELSVLFWAVLLLSVLLSIALVFSQPVWAASIEFTDREKRILKSLSLASLGPLPESPSNRFANHPTAQKLGELLFFEPLLSGNKKLSCASCHQVEKLFTDGHQTAVGIQKTHRNTPTLIASAWLTWLYWDGRRDSLWAQALIPFEAEAEMGGSRVGVLKVVAGDKQYRSLYNSLFSPLPLDLIGRLPAHAGPIGAAESQANWGKINEADQRIISGAFANIGKAIAAYERTLLPQETRFDRFVKDFVIEKKGKGLKLLSQAELLGAKLFLNEEKTQCLQCHNGPLLTNQFFHNVGTGNFDKSNPDYGRVWGIQAVLLDEFNCLGPYSDATEDQCHPLKYLNKEVHPMMYGAFKTPSLRYLLKTAPYFHDGSAKNLPTVIRHYVSPPRSGSNGNHELRRIELKPREISYLVAFLMSLSDSRLP